MLVDEASRSPPEWRYWYHPLKRRACAGECQFESERPDTRVVWCLSAAADLDAWLNGRDMRDRRYARWSERHAAYGGPRPDTYVAIENLARGRPGTPACVPGEAAVRYLSRGRPGRGGDQFRRLLRHLSLSARKLLKASGRAPEL